MEVPIGLAGCQVWRIAFDHQVRLMLTDDSTGQARRIQVELIVETPFSLRDAAGVLHELEPGTGSRLAPVLDLFNNTVSTVEIGHRGALHLGFADRAELRVPPHPQFESWQLIGQGTAGILVGPGGHDDWQS